MHFCKILDKYDQRKRHAFVVESFNNMFCPCPTSSLPTHRNDSKRQTINTKAIVNPNNIQNNLKLDGQQDIVQDGDFEMRLIMM